MHNKKILAKGLALGLVLSNIPIDSMANVIDESNINREEDKNTNLKKEEKEDKIIEIKESLDDFFKNLFNRDDNESNYKSNKEVIKTNPNVRTGTVLEITLSDGQFIEDLSGNPGGYETVRVTTEGGKKLVEADYDKLRLSGIPKVDLSDAWSDSIPAGAFSNATHLTEFKFPQGIKSISIGASNYFQGSFYNCKNLTGSLTIPESVTTIGKHAFRGCSGFAGSLTIPSSVTTIGQFAFNECDNIEKIIIAIDESHLDVNYRQDTIKYLPTSKTYIEMSYNFDATNTWLETTNYIKAKPIISTYAGNFENNEGLGISLEVIEASLIKTMTILKDGESYNLEKSDNGKYIFNESGNYQIYIETELGTISNIEFKNIPPINIPGINIIDNNLNIVNNGILSSTYIEKENSSDDFDNSDDLKFNFSNSNWNIENGTLKSETINHSSSTENEFIINAQAGDKLQIRVKTSSENNYDWGYIYLNGSEVYKKSGTSNDFEVLELDLQEGENNIKFKYSKDSGGSNGADAMSIDYIKILKKEVITIDCDTLEYRIDGGDWQTYTGSFELNYPAGTKVQVEVRASHDGFTSTILSQEVTVELNTQEIEEAIEKAEQSKNPNDVSDARDLVNQMPESSKKDEFQGRLDTIFPRLTLAKESATSNVDIYIKSENMLRLTLSTNSITFEDFSGVDDMVKENAINLTVNSSLPYKINAYMPTDIENADGTNIMNKEILNIRANGQTNYNTFVDNATPIVLLDDQPADNDASHGIDLMLKGNIVHEKDVYKTTIKFEVEQK